MPNKVNYRAKYNRFGLTNLEKRFTLFGYEFWFPIVCNLTLFEAQRVMERRGKKPVYFLDDGTTVPDLW